MRTIKFRAWDGSKLSVISPYLFEEMAWMNWKQVNEQQDFVFMQYTGLQDRDGKEIYEGDIVRLESPTPMAIEFNKGSFRAGHIYGGEEAYRMEIIGNIYENPELLK
jgi:hypothetical protein